MPAMEAGDAARAANHAAGGGDLAAPVAPRLGVLGQDRHQRGHVRRVQRGEEGLGARPLAELRGMGGCVLPASRRRARARSCRHAGSVRPSTRAISACGEVEHLVEQERRPLGRAQSFEQEQEREGQALAELGQLGGPGRAVADDRLGSHGPT
jgi:hypothetical protein